MNESVSIKPVFLSTPKHLETGAFKDNTVSILLSFNSGWNFTTKILSATPMGLRLYRNTDVKATS